MVNQTFQVLFRIPGISPLDNIKSDRIVGIQWGFPGYELLFTLGIYLPSASHNLEDCVEHFNYLWALYDFLLSSCKAFLWATSVPI